MQICLFAYQGQTHEIKLLILQRLYNISDEMLEEQIIDCRHFNDFLELSSGDKVPDARTIWPFKNRVIEKGLEKILFQQFNDYLDSLGLFINEGQIIDASFVEVPRQHNHKDENKQIKEGKGDEFWENEPYKKRQKDIDARWTKKNNETYYGYKNHIKADDKSKLLATYEVTDTSVHDSQPTEDLLQDSDTEQPLYADSAYTGVSIANILKYNGII
jgi:IS5 family transposase